MRISVPLNNLRLPWKKAIQAAAELGAEAIELDARGDFKPRSLSQSGIRQLRKDLDDFHLRVSSLSFYTRRGYHVLNDLDQRVQATKEAMDLAYKLGAAVVVNYVGQVPAKPEGPIWETLTEVLQDLGRYGQRSGAVLAGRTGAEDGAALASLIAALPEGALAVDLDPGGLIVNGFSVSDAVVKLAKHVVSVHARDAVHDISQGRGVEVPLGEGSVDFPEILGTLEQCNYGGFLTVERESAREPLSELRQAVDYLRGM